MAGEQMAGGGRDVGGATDHSHLDGLAGASFMDGGQGVREQHVPVVLNQPHGFGHDLPRLLLFAVRKVLRAEGLPSTTSHSRRLCAGSR